MVLLQLEKIKVIFIISLQELFEKQKKDSVISRNPKNDIELLFQLT